MAQSIRLSLLALVLSTVAAGCAVGVDDNYKEPVVAIEDTSSLPAPPRSDTVGTSESADRDVDNHVYVDHANRLDREADAPFPVSYTFELVANADVTITISRRTEDGPRTIGFTLHRITGTDNFIDLGEAYGHGGSVSMSLYTVHGGTYAVRLLDGVSPKSLVLKLSCNSGACAPRRQPGETCANDGNTKCDKGLVCLFESGACDAPDEPGRCQLAPVQCPKTYEPICGCNGETWGNRCYAEQAGVSVLYAGECK